MSAPDNYVPPDEEQEMYKQELGLKKMLYRYQHENEQLKAQIKALTQRLADIRTKKEEQPAPPSPDKQNQYRLALLRQEMKTLYSQIQKTNQEIKKNKEDINQFQELRCVDLTNNVKKEEKEIEDFKKQIEQYQKMQHFKNFNLQQMELQHSSLRISSTQQKKKQIQEELENTRKRIREIERGRDQHDRQALKKHKYAIGLHSKTREYQQLAKESSTRPIQPDASRKDKGLWHMQYTEENYKVIKDELKELKKQKKQIIDSLKSQNQVLKGRFAELSQDAQQFNKSIHLPEIEPPRNIRKSSRGNAKLNTIKLNSSMNSSRINSPPRLLNVGPREFQRSNDKNYQPKKLRNVEWESANFRTNGIEWSDAHLRSPINGINFWFDGSLVGLQFLHRMGESSQHLHLVTKSISPVQYRLNGNDYLQNVILWISDNKITGIELFSKNGRHDQFGSKSRGRKFDFGIKNPEKPVISYGRFRITNNISEITKLGFEAV